MDYIAKIIKPPDGRVALCISGTLRQFKTCYTTLVKRIIKASEINFQFDIFFTTWKSKITHYKSQPRDEGTYKEALALYNPTVTSREIYNQDRRDELYHESRMDEFQKYMRHQHIDIEGSGQWQSRETCPVCGHQSAHRKGHKCRICGSDNIHNQIGMLYNIWKCNQLKKEYEKKHGFIYDYVIRTRPDNYMISNLSISYYNTVTDKNVLVPEGYDDFPEYGSGINDQFAIGTSKNIDTYSDVYPNLYDHAMRHSLSKYGYGVPHKSIKDQILLNGLDLVRIPLRYVIYKRYPVYQKVTLEMKPEDFKNLRV